MGVDIYVSLFLATLSQYTIFGGLGALIFGLSSIACGFDMLNKVEEGESYIVNQYFHLITGIIFVVLLLIFLYPLLQKLTPKK
ncbi:MAG: hypothetical protein ACFE68_07665 [Candidatus Hodarchaeota archaeon]